MKTASKRFRLTVFGSRQRQALWSEALAVGDAEWLDRLFPGGRSPKLTLTPFEETPTVAEGSPTYALLGPKREQQQVWRNWTR